MTSLTHSDPIVASKCLLVAFPINGSRVYRRGLRGGSPRSFHGLGGLVTLAKLVFCLRLAGLPKIQQCAEGLWGLQNTLPGVQGGRGRREIFVAFVST